MSLRTRTSPLPHDCVLRAAWLPTSVLVVAAVAAWDPTHRPEALGGRPRVRRAPVWAAAARWVSWLSKAFQGSIGVSFQGCTPQPGLSADLPRRPTSPGLRS
jgi:hypothetical protein